MEKKSKARIEKEKTLAEIETLASNSKSIVFVDYRGMTVEKITSLRAKFRQSGVVYKVYKNNLVRIALNNLGITDIDDRFVGTLAVAFSQNDEVSAAKIIKEFSKENKDKMAFKFGLVGKTFMDAAEVEKLADMPSKETLVAQLLGLLQSGARGLATVINAVPRNLAVVVNARAGQLK